MREKLLSRMIRIYGFEHKTVIEFAFLMETSVSDKMLETIVKCHEDFPLIDNTNEDE